MASTRKGCLLKEFRPEYFNLEKDIEIKLTIHAQPYKPKDRTYSNKKSEEDSKSQESEEESESQESDNEEDACKEPARWVEASGGEVPGGAVVGGEYDGETVYVARAEHAGDMLPGKLVPSHRVCYVPWGCEEHSKSNYEVLVSDDLEKLVWLEGSDGSIPSGALQGGETATDEPLYIGRCKQENTLTCGKACIHRSLKGCFIGYGGREYGYARYEVLAVKQTNEEQAVKTIPETKTKPKEPEKEDDGLSDFERRALQRHNYYRKKHGAPALTMDREICQYSQDWAEQLAHWNRLEHRGNVGRKDGKQYGENCYMSMGKANVSAEEVVDAWYDEVCYHNYSWNSFVYQTGHFTQVVWTETKRVGIGKARNGPNWFVVSSYDPPGNYQGRFTRCVRPPVD
ncbi:unnamed protein product [Darwinula stevensoni]|uniref:SCP domain-containing protein n=1 Tax=Darwinula stevensoni TaxID=69355 RepID=A0A7R9AE01_9CRUS|nr:unnamed protein product [Darwinula stevensoni]CAG0901450.1 unnamed protein product [Darwinula stevensoni]